MLTNERAAVEHVKTVYRVAYGGGLPWGWKGKIIEAYRDGLWSELAAIDAAAMPGSKAATPKDRTWGFGWLMRYVSGKLAEKAQTEAAQKRAQGSAANAAGQRAAQEEQRKADMAKRRAYFAALPEIKQQVYRQAAASQRFAPKGKPEIIEAMAAELAWQTSQELAEAREGQA